MSRIQWCFLWILLGTSLVWSYLYFFFMDFVFPRTSIEVPIQNDVQCMWIESTFVLHIQARQENTNQRAILFAHGNFGNVTYHQFRLHEISALYPDVDIYCFEYTGYGRMYGTPSCDNFYEPGLDVYHWLRPRYKNIALVGESMGAAACIQMLGHLTKNPPEKVVVINPFSSLRKLVEYKVGAFLMSFLKCGEIDNENVLSCVLNKCPKLNIQIYCCKLDEIIPNEHSKKLASLSFTCRLEKISGTHMFYTFPKIY